MIAKKKQFGTNYIFFIVLFYLMLIVGTSLWWSINRYTKEMKDRLYPTVYIDNVSFGWKTTDDVKSYFDKKNLDLKKINFTILYQNIQVATISAQNLNLRYDSQGMADRSYLIGRSSNLPSQIYQKVASLLHWQNFNIDSFLEYDKSAFEEFITRSQQNYDRPAKNALFKFENGKVISFRREEKGVEIEVDNFRDDFNQSVNSLKKNITDQTIVLKSHPIEPEITLAQTNNFGIEELIGAGKSDFSHSIPGRVHNIILAASKFNGVLIPKNEILSFNKTVGDISALTGYQPAYIIKEGKTVLGDGGGVCQVSTTLFRAALNAGLPIMDRVAHAYRVGYYENDSKPGFDATVFDPYADLKIKNDTGAYILIETEVDRQNNIIYFKLYGKKDNRQATISSYQMWDVTAPPPDIRQDDPTLKKGVVKQVDFAAWGSKVTFNYKVVNNGQTIFQKNFFSAYRPWQAVYLRGTAD